MAQRRTSCAILIAVLAMMLCIHAADAQCQIFYDGLCPGPDTCKCTLGESCSGERHPELARTADGGCSGSCRQVDTGDCPGDSSCLLDAGSCGAPAPPPDSGCQIFYDGLCPGPSSCKCTLGESCSGERHPELARTADGGCSGSCRQVDTGDCPGDSSCLLDAGSCDGPAPSPPESGCQIFYDGLCPGPDSCKCTLGESCSGERHPELARTADGGCSGECRQVDTGDCPGDSSCLLDAGSCSAPAPPSPPSGTCYTFYDGLCPGPSSCKCTLSEPCGSELNYEKARTADGGCSGSCRQVDTGDCPGGASCLYDAGACYVPPPPGQGSHGGDVSTYVDSSQWSCAVSGGYTFMIVRSYCSIGAVDPNAGPTLAQAAAGGVTTRDIYHFPCFGVDAAQQVQDNINNVGMGNFGTLWFDIETNYSPGCGYSGDLSANCNFLQALIDAGSSLGVTMGVYASEYMWGSIMGGGCTAGGNLPLWFPNYDGSPSFADFNPFGGWSSAVMKQYNDGSAIAANCGISADANWRL